MALKQLTISIISIILFSIAILGFGIGFASDNDASVSISDDSEISSLSADLKVNIDQFKDDSESTYQSIVESSTEGETTPTGGSFAITPGALKNALFSIFRTGYIKIFGADSGFGIFLTALITMIVFLFGIYIWKAWIGRSPD